jgi:hypothetical protein
MVGPYTRNGIVKDGKIIAEWLPMRSRRTRRPRIRWLDDEFNDMKVLNVENWKELVLDNK